MRGIHLVHAERVGALTSRAAGDGWAVAEMEGGATLREALERLGGALGFPAYYGRNMDAAWDCLTDLTEPTMLVWNGWQRLAVDHPEDWSSLMGMLRERCAVQPECAVVLAR